jgi:hypothetical protein
VAAVEQPSQQIRKYLEATYSPPVGNYSPPEIAKILKSKVGRWLSAGDKKVDE